MDLTKAKFSFLFVALFLFLSHNVLGQSVYNWNGKKWADNSATYHVNTDLSIETVTNQQWAAAIDSAAVEWDGAGANFRFLKGGDVTYGEQVVPSQNISVLGWYATANTQTGAYTVPYVDPNDTNVIVKMETYFNIYYSFSTNPGASEVDIWSEAAHELGHRLDLEDETSDPNEVMYAYETTTDHYLGSGDIAGIQNIYGAGSWVVNSDVTQNEGWYGNVSVEPDNGSDYIYIRNSSTVEMYAGCNVTLGAGMTMYVNAGSQLIEDGGSQAIYGIGSQILSNGGIITGIDSTGGGGNTPPPPAGFAASVSGQNVLLKWQLPAFYGTTDVTLVKNGNPIDLGSSATSYTDAGAVSSLPATYSVQFSESSSQENIDGISYSDTISLGVAPTTVSTDTTWSGTVYLGSSVTINSGNTLTISPGTTVLIGSGNSITANGSIDANGSPAGDIFFQQADSGNAWNEIELNSNGNQFTDCVFDGGTDNVYTSHSQGNTFTDCTFENARGDGLLLEGSGSSIDNCTFEHNQYGIVLGYAGPTASIVQSTISDNSAVGLYMASGTISQFTNNAVENNGSYGIDIEGGILYMGNGTSYYDIGSNPVASSPTQGAGKNLINNNGSSQIYVDTGGEVYVGDLQFNGTDYSLGEGFNRVTSSSTYYIYNLAMTQTYESEEQWPVPAADTYWGGSVGSENFYGTVNYYSDQLLSDPSIGAGATNTLQDVTTPGGAKTPATLMTAAMAAKIYKDAPTSGMGQFFVNLKNQMMQVRGAIINPKTGLIRPRLVGYLNSLCSFDTNDVTQERGAVYDLITSYYRELTSGNFTDETDRLCSEAALVAEVQDEVASGKLDSADALISTYGKYVQNNDNQRTLLFNQMEIDQRHGQDGSALGVLKQIEGFQPDSRQKKGYEPPDYSVIASLLGQGTSISRNKEVASVQTQVPTKFALLQNYPNPFNPTTTIDYDLATPANVSLVVYDVTGQEVIVLESGQESTGSHSAIFNGSRFASGVYFVRLVARGQNGRQYIKTIKMAMIK